MSSVTLFDVESYDEREFDGVVGGDRAPMITCNQEPTPRASHPAGIIGTSQTDHHPTPEKVWRPGLAMTEAGRYCLDPASYAGSPIPCDRIFTKEDDGLSQPWTASFLWSNFPYSSPQISPKTGKQYAYPVMDKWIGKLCASHEAGLVGEALTIVKSDCRPEWFHRLLEVSSAHCFIRGGLKFGGNENTSFFGSVLFYLGDRPSVFAGCYAHLGPIGYAYSYGT